MCTAFIICKLNIITFLLEEKNSNIDNNFSNLIQSHLNSLILEENPKKVSEADNDILRRDLDSVKDDILVPMMSVQESAVSSVSCDDIIIDELLPEHQASCDMDTVHKENYAKFDFDVSFDDCGVEEDEIIVEELLTDDSEPEKSDSDNEKKIIVQETDSNICNDKESISKSQKMDKMSGLNIEELEICSFEINTGESSLQNEVCMVNSSEVGEATIIKPESVTIPGNEESINCEVSITSNLVGTEDVNQDGAALKLSDNAEKILNEEIVTEFCPVKNMLINKNNSVNVIEKNSNKCENKDKNLKLKTPYQDLSKSGIIMTENPVHIETCDSDFNIQEGANCMLNKKDTTPNSSSEICISEPGLVSDNVTEVSMSSVQSNIKAIQENSNNHVCNSEKTIDSRIKAIGMSNNINCSTGEISVVDNEGEKIGLNISSSKTDLVCIVPQTDLNVNKSNHCNDSNNKIHKSENDILENHTVVSKNSFLDDENIAQKDVQQNGSSSSISPKPSDVLSSVIAENNVHNVQNENLYSNGCDSSGAVPSIILTDSSTFDSSQKEGNVMLPADDVQNAGLSEASTVESCDKKAADVILSGTFVPCIDLSVTTAAESCTEGNVILSTSTGCKIDSPITITLDSHDNEVTEIVCDSFCAEKCDSTLSILQIPKIIVTPASESEEELEEYLRGQLEHFHSEVSPQEDFSVTSEYSSRPFDDVFGSYVSGDSSDYIEAFNFEFDNGNFYEDYIDDYPHNLETGINDRLCPNDGQQKRSSSLPLMTENLSDDDSLTMKSDSSLMYDSLKGITRL